MGFLVDQKIRMKFSWLPPLQLLESLVFLHQETLVLLLKKLDNGLKANSTHKFPMESLTVFIMEKTAPLLTLESFRDGLNQQPASQFPFLMLILLELLLSVSMKAMDAPAKKRQSPLSKTNSNLTLMTNSCPPSTTVLGISSTNLDLVISLITLCN